MPKVELLPESLAFRQAQPVRASLPDNYFIHKDYKCNTIPIISIPSENPRLERAKLFIPSDDDNIYEMNKSAKSFIPKTKPKINIFIYFNK